jgi:hypothetical protein
MRWFACLLLLLLPAGAAWAQGDIHRCIGADGNPIFTDQRCVDVHATPVTAPPSSASSAQPSAPQVPAATLCAASASELKQAVVDAFAARDPNRLAGLMLWGGYGDEAVVNGIRELGRLMQSPLLDIKVQPAGGTADGAPAVAGSTPAPAAGSATDPATDDVLVLHTASDDGSGQPHETRYVLVRRSGCLWLQPQG